MRPEILAKRARHTFPAAAFLFTVCLLLYANTAFNQFAFDDNGLVLENRFFIDGTSVQEIFTTNYRFGANTPGDGLYRPLAMFSCYLNFLVAGLDPVSFHLTNVVLHAIVTVLLFMVVRQLTGGFLLSLLTSMLFAAHPIHTEAVANVAGRPELLYTAFLLAAWLMLETIKRPAISYPVSALLLFGALLSKETAVVFPFLVLTVDYIRNKLPRKQMLARFAVLLAAVGVYLVIRWAVLGGTAIGSIPRYYDNPLYFMDPAMRAANALVVLGHYLSLTLLPWRLISDYSLNTVPLTGTAGSVVPLAMVAAGVIGLYFAFRRKSSHPEYLYGAALFVFPWFLVSNLVLPVGTVMGERLMYFPSAGMMLILACGLLWLLQRQRLTMLALTAAIMTFYAVQTVARNRDWYDDRTITVRDFEKAPENIKLMANMGWWAKQDGKPDLAQQYYQQAVDRYPGFAEGLNGLGRIAYDRGDLETARQFYRRAAESAPRDIILQFNYVSVLIKLNEFTVAENVLEEAIARDPGAFILYRGMGNLRLAQFRFQEAIGYYEEALERGDNRRICFTNLTAAAFYAGQYEQAWNYVLRAREDRVTLDPELVESVRQRIAR